MFVRQSVEKRLFLNHRFQCLNHDNGLLNPQGWRDTTPGLDRMPFIHVNHSTGGEVARYLGRHGSKRAAKAVWIGVAPPLTLKTAAHPGGLPMEAFDQIRAAVHNDRAQFFKGPR